MTPHKMKTAVIVSEDAAWTTPLDAGYESCLPKTGLKVLDHVRFSPDTTDFTPIFNKIEALKPDVMITGISHVGTQPTVQWKSQQVPIPMLGISSQATNSTFWKDTNGATEGVLFNAVSGPGVAVTPKTLPFVAAYQKKYGNAPAYSRLHGVRRGLHDRRGGPSRRLDRQRQARRRDGEDRLRRHDRPGRIPAEGRPACARPAHRRGLHHRPDAAVAERQAAQPVAEGAGRGRR